METSIGYCSTRWRKASTLRIAIAGFCIGAGARSESAGLSNLAAYDCLDELTGVLKRPFGEMKARQAAEALRLFGIPFAWMRVAIDDIDGHEHRYG